MSAPAKVDRRGFFGASDVGPLLGFSQYKDAFGLYLEKRGEIDAPEEESKVQRRGKILEPAIAQLYAAEHNAEILPGQVFIGAEAWQRAQVDAIEVDDGSAIPIEIKSASEYTRSKWGPSGTDDAPTDYCGQLHWQMAAMGAPRGRIVALLGADDLRVYTIQRDPKIDAFLQEQVREFWQRVLDGRAPEPNYQHPSIGETLGRLFKNPNATEILQATPALIAWRDVFLDASEHRLRYEKMADGAKAHLLAAMRNAGILNFGDGTMLERKEISRKGYTVEATKFIQATIKKSGDLPALTHQEAA